MRCLIAAEKRGIRWWFSWEKVASLLAGKLHCRSFASVSWRRWWSNQTMRMAMRFDKLSQLLKKAKAFSVCTVFFFCGFPTGRHYCLCFHLMCWGIEWITKQTWSLQVLTCKPFMSVSNPFCFVGAHIVGIGGYSCWIYSSFWDRSFGCEEDTQGCRRRTKWWWCWSGTPSRNPSTTRTRCWEASWREEEWAWSSPEPSFHDSLFRLLKTFSPPPFPQLSQMSFYSSPPDTIFSLPIKILIEVPTMP